MIFCQKGSKRLSVLREGDTVTLGYANLSSSVT